MNIWYLGRTKPRQEAKAKFHLQRQGFETYLPMIYADRRAGKPAGIEPMFCGYIFIRSGSLDFQRVRSTLGMQHLVRFGEFPAQISGVHIDQLRACEDENGLHGKDAGFQAGDPVRITDGPFKDYSGIVSGTRNGRIRVLLGRLTPVEVDESCLCAE